jgi:hypothetical protein
MISLIFLTSVDAFKARALGSTPKRLTTKIRHLRRYRRDRQASNSSRHLYALDDT